MGYYSRLHGSHRYVFVIFHFSWLIVNIVFFYNIHSCFCARFFPTFLFAGFSIHACRNVHRHIAALETDVDIFEALLAPLIVSRPAPEVTLEDRVTSLDDLEGENITVERIVKRSRLTK
jgi:hypothetical protein